LTTRCRIGCGWCRRSSHTATGRCHLPATLGPASGAASSSARRSYQRSFTLVSRSYQRSCQVCELESGPQLALGLAPLPIKITIFAPNMQSRSTLPT